MVENGDAVFDPAIARPKRDIPGLLRQIGANRVRHMDDDIDRAAAARRGSPYLTAKQAAHFLGLSPRSLRRLRTQGKGPTVRRHGNAVLYHVDDLAIWSRNRVIAKAERAGS